MAVTRGKNSGVYGSKYISFNAGYPGVMPAPTAADGGTGTTATVSFSTVSGATSYTAISTPGSFTGTGASSPVTVSGLTAGTAYTFQISATNSVGTGAYSSASNSVTPVVPTAYESIASLTGTGSNTSWTFNSIPQTYKHLQIRAVIRENNGGNASNSLKLSFNNSGSTIGRSHWLEAQGNGGGVQAGYDSGDMYMRYISVGSAARANSYGFLIMDILDYSATNKNKIIRNFYGVNDNNNAASSQVIASNSNLWVNTSAINAITLLSQSGNTYTTLSNVSLYGIKGS